MKAFSKSKEILDTIKNKINSNEFMINNRLKNTDFTRERKLPFPSLICFLLNSIKQTLQKELTHFMNLFTQHGNVTKSAFCQQRLKLKPEAFIELNDTLIEKFYADASYTKWGKFRLLCIDGSTLELPKSDEIIAKFGVNNEQNNIPMAKVSTLYDLLNHLLLNSTIEHNYSSEYSLTLKHMDKIRARDLLVLDRGYGARWLFFLINQKKAEYVVRLQFGFGEEADSFWSSKEETKIIEVKELPAKSKTALAKMGITFEPFKYRLVKVYLDNDEIEVLATSLLDEKEYPNEIFKEIYNKRWGIEVNYNHLKNHIEIGNFTGFSSIAIKQDFYANAFISNIQSLIIHDAQKELDDKCNGRKYVYKINRNLSLGYMKNKIVGILTSKNPKHYNELVRLFQIEPVPVRPDRYFPRDKSRHKRKFYMNQKRAL